MPLTKIMNTDLVTINLDATLNEVKNIFELVNFHHILVLEGEKLVGVVSDRDYLKSTSPSLGTVIETARDSSALNIKVHRVMSRNLVTIKETDSIFEAVCAFYKTKMSCLPVVDQYFRPVGIISWKDIIDQLALNMIKNRKNLKTTD